MRIRRRKDALNLLTAEMLKAGETLSEVMLHLNVTLVRSVSAD